MAQTGIIQCRLHVTALPLTAGGQLEVSWCYPVLAGASASAQSLLIPTFFPFFHLGWVDSCDGLFPIYPWIIALLFA